MWVGQGINYYKVKPSEKHEVAHFVSIFTLTVLKSMHFGVPTSLHKMHHFDAMDERIDTKSFSHVGHCHSFDLHPFGHKSIQY